MDENSLQHCKNCSTEIDGKFCHFCGQRYHDHKESFGELVYEFASDFLHFDSRFFKTVFPLLFSPGKLTKSYNEGKQRSQFHPIRLYLFSSFVYFFLFFTFNDVEKNTRNKGDLSDIKAKSDSVLNIALDSLRKSKNVEVQQIDSIFSPSNGKNKVLAYNDSSTNFSFSITKGVDSLMNKNVTPEKYLESQKLLPKKERAGFLERIITVKLLKLNLEDRDGRNEFFRKALATFLHNIPKMLFLLLPVFALLLKLLYIRRKEFFYVDHAILSLHFFSFIFLLLILSNYILNKIFGTTSFSGFAALWISVYLYMAMKKLYGQGWMKTLVKYVALGFMFSISILFVLLINMVWSTLMM